MITSDTGAVADHVNQALDLLAMSREYLTQSDLHQVSDSSGGTTVSGAGMIQRPGSTSSGTRTSRLAPMPGSGS